MALDGPGFAAACAQGDDALAAAMAQLHREHAPRLLREARSALGPVEAVNDLVQATFAKAWRYCADYEGRAGVLAWMMGILRHAIIDHVRATRPSQDWVDDQGAVLPEVEQALQAAAANPTLDPERWALQAERFRVYQACAARFAAADPQAALALRWSAEHDMSIDELAQALGRTPAATRQYLSQCRKKARVHFAPWYGLLRDE